MTTLTHRHVASRKVAVITWYLFVLALLCSVGCGTDEVTDGASASAVGGSDVPNLDTVLTDAATEDADSAAQGGATDVPSNDTLKLDDNGNDILADILGDVVDDAGNGATDAAAIDVDFAELSGDASVANGDVTPSDVVVVVSSALCNPCAKDSECGVGNECVSLGDQGSYCGQKCGSDIDCPADYVCMPTATSKQCQPVDPPNVPPGSVDKCKCSVSAIVKSLATQCYKSAFDANGLLIGKCAGSRTCAGGLLTACDAKLPAVEICDAVDNNCDGTTDNTADCDDKNPCTTDACDGKGGCKHVSNTGPCDADGSECTLDQCKDGACAPGPSKICVDDGNPCTDDVCVAGVGCGKAKADGGVCVDGAGFCAIGACLAGKCQGGVTNGCDDKNICTKDACDATSGKCSFQPVDGPCDDASACSLNDACKAGVCVGAALKCDDLNPCTIDSCDAAKGCANTPADGNPCEDGDLCTTGETCKNNACQGALQVECKADSSCVTGSCDKVTGKCANTALGDSTPCSDANACTANDACKSGACTGSVLVCDDGSPCTDDKCDPTQGCINTPNKDACDDGSGCTVGDVCVDGGCVAGATKNCDDSNICTADSCDVKTGDCNHAGQAGPCDDGKICTKNDTCVDGVCAGALDLCNDGTACTDDSCDVEKGCQHPNNTALCDDDNACTNADSCKLGVCAGVVDAAGCDDKNLCTTDSCDPKSGCLHANNAVACDDGNGCTNGDACKDGACQGGAFTCQCAKNADCAKFDDANLCNGSLICSANVCAIDLATVVVCDIAGNTACAANTCDAVTGKCAPAPVNEGKSCDADGSVCTQGDSCQAGKCQAGPALVCDDKNPCTNDTCDSGVGCVALPNAAACDDLSACTSGDICKDGACVGPQIKVCNDANPCTNDACNSKTGCTISNNVAACDDGLLCTTGDVCSAGVCAGLGKKVCDDGNVCSSDKCDPIVGCVFTPLNAGNCNDGNLCTLQDVCVAGKCTGFGAKVCSDGNACTADSCDALSGACLFAVIVGCGGNCNIDADCPVSQNTCVVNFCDIALKKCAKTTLADGVKCDDGNKCTAGDVCVGGNCAKGKVTACDDLNTCTTDFCDPLNGNCAHVNNIGACDDGSKCTSGDFCAYGKCTAGNTVACNDSNPCTSDSCEAATGKCTATPIPGCVTICKIDSDCAKSANPCQVNYCNAGACANKAAANFTPCNDGDACSAQDLCAAGVCQGTNFIVCNDNNLCTDDSCNHNTGKCVSVNNAGACTDGTPCTQGDLCVAGTCIPGPAKVCDDNNACTKDSCNASSGVCAANPINGCGGFCAADSDCPAVANVCLNAVCDKAAGKCTTQAKANNTLCDDKNGCSGLSNCQQGVCTGANFKVCNDGNLCTNDACDAKTGACITTPNNGIACNDGNACTQADTCAGNVCNAGTPKACNDNVACTKDSCDVKTGNCVFTPIIGCAGNCAVDLDCPPSGNTCTSASCNAASKKCVLLPVANGLACSDGKPCTLVDVCKNGACESGAVKDCNDNNVCTTDGCDPTSGNCLHVNLFVGACSDGDACTSGDTCVNGKCTPLVTKLCNDAKICTADSCDVKTGQCVFSPIVGCGNFCAKNSDCKDDGNACTAEYCANDGKCAAKPAAKDTVCDDKNACTVTDVCNGNNTVCAGAVKSCDDKNVCTNDLCDPAGGKCYAVFNFNVCDDGNKCTLVDLCGGGTCNGQVPLPCNDLNKCTTDACDKATGKCVYTPIIGCK